MFLLDKEQVRLYLVLFFLWPVCGQAMGLRSFVALPIQKDGSVVRFLSEYNDDSDVHQLTSNVAYGWDHRQTFFLSLPYRLSPSGGDRFGDVTALYRNIVYQNDQRDSTLRLGLLGGATVPTDDDRDWAVPFGWVTTYYRGRNEIDIDMLYELGLSDRNDRARYDLSWQYRFLPREYPDWGVPAELNSVIELRGTWREDDKTIHEATLGLQWIHQFWVIEGGAVRDFNGPHETQYLLSLRLHF